ncbi:MAG: hypothetical protein FE78DRAFT_68685, partial [Acidomyces sp. 'richmondensis']
MCRFADGNLVCNLSCTSFGARAGSGQQAHHGPRLALATVRRQAFCPPLTWHGAGRRPCQRALTSMEASLISPSPTHCIVRYIFVVRSPPLPFALLCLPRSRPDPPIGHAIIVGVASLDDLLSFPSSPFASTMFWRCGAVLSFLASTALGQGGPLANGLSLGSPASNLSSEIFPPPRNLTSSTTSSASGDSSFSSALSAVDPTQSGSSSLPAPSSSSSSLSSETSFAASNNGIAANIPTSVTTTTNTSTDIPTESVAAAPLIPPSLASPPISSVPSASQSLAQYSSDPSPSLASDGSPLTIPTAFGPQASEQNSTLVPSGAAQSSPGTIIPGVSELSYDIVSLLSSAIGPIDLPSGVLSPPPLPPRPPVLSPPSIPGLTLPYPSRPTSVGPGSVASFSTSLYSYATNSTILGLSSGAKAVSSKPPQPKNTTCGGTPTLNVLDASLDWWWAPTYTYAASTFVTQFAANGSATGWSLAPAPTPFNVSSALAQPT